MSRLLFVDVETTGLLGSDRVVSLGAILLDAATLYRPQWDRQDLHLVFNPGRKSHPRAEAVHGWSDWALRHQEPFGAHAETLAALFAQADLIVAHNAGFDWRFIASEFHAAGQPAPRAPRFCTMLAWRRRFGTPSGLDHALARLGLRRGSDKHGAFEDAWFAMCVYLWLHGLPQPPADGRHLPPSNQRAVPAQPPALGRHRSLRAAVGAA